MSKLLFFSFLNLNGLDRVFDHLVLVQHDKSNYVFAFVSHLFVTLACFVSTATVCRLCGPHLPGVDQNSGTEDEGRNTAGKK